MAGSGARYSACACQRRCKTAAAAQAAQMRLLVCPNLNVYRKKWSISILTLGRPGRVPAPHPSQGRAAIWGLYRASRGTVPRLGPLVLAMGTPALQCNVPMIISSKKHFLHL